jgi:DNA modification methylase
MELNKTYIGDALSVLKTFPDETVDCVITSPPYWALRDYGMDGQLGLEPTFEEFVNDLCDIFDEVKRVLKKSGTCWVNLGDTYNSSQAAGDKKFGNEEFNKNRPSREKTLTPRKRKQQRLKNKCLLQIPSRFAIEMCDRGWILRNEIIWQKPNAMPSSAPDRFTVDFEKIFFFTKAERYFFNQQYDPRTQAEILEAMEIAKKYGYDGSMSYEKWYMEVREKKSWHDHSDDSGKGFGQQTRGSQSKVSAMIHPLGKVKRTTWPISTKPYAEAHFATYPPDLIETPMKAGCPRGGVVLDPFMGSGTTGYVAQKLGMNWLGIEINPEYLPLIQARTSQKTLMI